MSDSHYKFKYLNTKNMYEKVECLRMIVSPETFVELYGKTEHPYLKQQIIRIARHAKIYDLGLKESEESLRIEVVRCVHQDMKAKWALEDSNRKEKAAKPAQPPMRFAGKMPPNAKVDDNPMLPKEPMAVVEPLVEDLPENLEIAKEKQDATQAVPQERSMRTAIDDGNKINKSENVENKTAAWKHRGAKSNPVVIRKKREPQSAKGFIDEIQSLADNIVRDIFNKNAVSDIYNMDKLLELQKSNRCRKEIDRQIQHVSDACKTLAKLDKRQQRKKG